MQPDVAPPPAKPATTDKPLVLRERKPFTPGDSNRLQAIARGEHVDSVIHPAVLAEKAIVEVKNFNLWYGQKQALFDVTMPIPAGKVTAIIGPSGCGKSTLLRSVNRMNDLVPTVRFQGDMLLNGTSIYGPKVDVIELRKRLGMVFQKPNPFPMSIYDNVVYALKLDGERSRARMDEVCRESLQGAAL